MAVVLWNLSKTITLSIPSGGTETDELDLDVQRRDLPERALFLLTVTIISPPTLTGTVNPHTAEKTGGTYRMLQSSGNDIVIPANKTTVVGPFRAGSIKLVSLLAEAAQRDFIVMAGWASN